MTKQLQKAIDHIKLLHPNLSIVVFNRQGQWHYMDENFNGIIFDSQIDVSILEDASDSIEQLPAVFELIND